MTSQYRFRNLSCLSFVVIVLTFWCNISFAQGEAEKIDDLLDRLALANDAPQAERIVAELLIEWDKSGSNAIDFVYQRGVQSLERNDFLTATEHFTAAIDHDPAFLSPYIGRATAYFQSGDVGPAMADLAYVLSQEPRHFNALASVAVILEETAKKPQALTAFRQVVKLYPFIPEVNDAITRLEKELEGQEL